MGILDSLLAEVISSNTGLNRRMVRRMVRKAGGGRLIGMGGAAIAGALLVDKARGSQGGGVAPIDHSAGPPRGPAPGTRPESAPKPDLPPLPELPPLPSSAVPEPAAPTVASPPPLPEVEDPDVTLPKEVLYPVLRCVVAAGMADGRLDERERAAITEQMDDAELDPEQVEQLHMDLLSPAQPEELAGLVHGEDRELMLRFATLMTYADAQQSGLERAWILRLADALEISESRLSEIERELFAEAVAEGESGSGS